MAHREQSLAHWWKRLNDSREPSPAELAEQFAGLPADPRTGYPVGYVSFAVELEQRIEQQIGCHRELRCINGQEVYVRVIPYRGKL